MCWSGTTHHKAICFQDIADKFYCFAQSNNHFIEENNNQKNLPPIKPVGTWVIETSSLLWGIAIASLKDIHRLHQTN